MRILVAEDDSRLARLVERGLTAEGHDVQVAHDGEEALFLARGAGILFPGGMPLGAESRPQAAFADESLTREKASVWRTLDEYR